MANYITKIGDGEQISMFGREVQLVTVQWALWNLLILKKGVLNKTFLEKKF